MTSDLRERSESAHLPSTAARVARCRQKKLMLGGRRIVAWLDKESADALKDLEALHAPLSMTVIVGRLIKEAGRRISP